MFYALICTDNPNSLDLRLTNRPDHAAYLKSLGDTLVLAGPFTKDDGQTMNGSLIVVEAPSREAAKKNCRRRSLRQGWSVCQRRSPSVAMDRQQA